jgi:hypothetical protein
MLSGGSPSFRTFEARVRTALVTASLSLCTFWYHIMLEAEQQDVNACLSLTWCAVRFTDSIQHVGYLQGLFRMTSFTIEDLEPP